MPATPCTHCPHSKRVAASPPAGDVDFFVLSGLGRGRCLAQLGRNEEAWAALDEIMLHVVAGSTAPQVAGLAYCSVVALCLDCYDLRRAQEWTQALTDWLGDQHGMVAYRGTCLVHRAEILQLRGAWTEAAEEAGVACDRLAESGNSVSASRTTGSASWPGSAATGRCPSKPSSGRLGSAPRSSPGWPSCASRRAGRMWLPPGWTVPWRSTRL